MMDLAFIIQTHNHRLYIQFEISSAIQLNSLLICQRLACANEVLDILKCSAASTTMFATSWSAHCRSLHGRMGKETEETFLDQWRSVGTEGKNSVE